MACGPPTGLYLSTGRIWACKEFSASFAPMLGVRGSRRPAVLRSRCCESQELSTLHPAEVSFGVKSWQEAWFRVFRQVEPSEQHSRPGWGIPEDADVCFYAPTAKPKRARGSRSEEYFDGLRLENVTVCLNTHSCRWRTRAWDEGAVMQEPSATSPQINWARCFSNRR